MLTSAFLVTDSYLVMQNCSFASGWTLIAHQKLKMSQISSKYVLYWLWLLCRRSNSFGQGIKFYEVEVRRSCNFPISHDKPCTTVWWQHCMLNWPFYFSCFISQNMTTSYRVTYRRFLYFWRDTTFVEIF